jgi:subtilisin family serine protease
VLSFVFLVGFGSLNGQSDKISTSLLNIGDETEVVIHFEAYPGFDARELPYTKEEKGVYVYDALRRHALEAQYSVREMLDNEGIAYKSFCIANAILAKVSPDQLYKIAADAAVRRLTPNEVVEMSKPKLGGFQGDRSASPEWGLMRIGADSVWALGYRGQGVVIAGEDTGYDWSHPAISGAYRGNQGDTVDHNYNWHDAIHELSPIHNDTITDPADTPCGVDGLIPCDDNGHGTHTMGTMVGLDGDNIIGVAPDAKWIGVRCMDRGYGSPMTYVEGFEWFLAPTDVNGENPDPTKAPHVINNSWRCPELEGCNLENFDLIRQAIINLKAAGVVVVVSAGNEGNQGCSSIASPPSIFAESFAIGAMRSNDTIAGFSSRGPVLIDSSGTMKPDVTAPGVGVRSAWLDSTYRLASGTSMSGPHVAGTVALIISANPELAGQVEVIENILRVTAIPITTEEDCGGDAGQVPNNVYGFGRIDAVAAVEMALMTTAVRDIEVADDGFRIFPNPSSGKFRLGMATEGNVVDIRVITMQGRTVYAQRQHIVGSPIDLSELEAGIYLVSVSGPSNGNVVLRAQKLVIAR